MNFYQNGQYIRFHSPKRSNDTFYGKIIEVIDQTKIRVTPDYSPNRMGVGGTIYTEHHFDSHWNIDILDHIVDDVQFYLTYF